MVFRLSGVLESIVPDQLLFSPNCDREVCHLVKSSECTKKLLYYIGDSRKLCNELCHENIQYLVY